MRHYFFQLTFCALFLNTLLNAQYGSGTIIGTVTDPTAASVPGATVTIKNQETSASRNSRTDADGNYRFNAVPPGRYTATASAPSFKVTNIPDVIVTVNTETRVDFSMQVGAVSETVNVQAVTPVLQTDSASLGTAIDARTVHELPLNARNFFDLVALTPGATKVAGGSSVMDGRSVQVGGIRNTSTLTTLDGTDFTVANVNNPAIALSLDALQEFKVQVNFMDASYGHGAASIELVTKSGTNSFHGVAYDFVRNRAFNAGQFFRPRNGPPRFTYNQFANLGGPIWRDKTFFFVNYEGRRQSQGVILQGLIPTQEMLTGDFSGTGKTIRDPLNNNSVFPNNVIPQARWDPISKQLLQYFPLPNIVRPAPTSSPLPATSSAAIRAPCVSTII